MLWRPELTQQDNIEVDPKDLGKEESDWINVDRETDSWYMPVP